MAMAFFGCRRGSRLGGGLGGHHQRRGGPGDFTVLDDRQAPDRVVFHVDVDHAVFGLAQLFGQAEQVGAVQRGRLACHARSQVGVTDDGHTVLDHRFAGFGQFAVAALLGSHVHDHAAGLHALHHLSGDQLGRGFAGDQRSGDDDVALFGLLGVHLALRGLEAFAHDLGVTAAARAFFFVIHLDEFTAERHDLVGHFGTGVVGTHNGTQAGGCANRGQTGHTGTGNEHLGWGHFARGRDLTIEETTKSVGRFHDCAVTADTGHGGQRVHLLGAAQCAGQGINGERRDFFGSQHLHQVGVLGGPQKADQGLAFVHQRDFVRCGGTHLEDDIAAAPQCRRARGNGRAGFDIGRIRQVGEFARALFHHHGKAEFDQLAYCIGD